MNLARVYAKLRALQVLNWRSAWTVDQGVPNMAEASAVKVMGTEFFDRVLPAAARDHRRQAGIVLEGESGASSTACSRRAYRRRHHVFTFGGGVNEVQRDIIAAAGLGQLPRGRAGSKA